MVDSHRNASAVSNGSHTGKVTASHLTRDAFLYVRQSTLQQLVHNTESTQRQYDLRQRAVALGWPADRVHVIDCDLGQSGASAADRVGFQQLVSEVSLGHAGIVLGLEVSRLARNSTDWHRLMELCALSDTLILDEDGLYDCNDFNDRLILGMKGTISEVELHYIRARLRGGILNKARRGELVSPLPVGLIYDEAERVQLDPDVQVQAAIRLLFATFQRTGSARATLKHFRDNNLQFPRRLQAGIRKGELIWSNIGHSRILQTLHNPRYAGAFFFGRTKMRIGPNGKAQYNQKDRSDWIALIPDAHPGYITWEEFEDNQKRLLENAQREGLDRRKSPPGDGPALLQGMVICGVCGRRMTVRYHDRRGQLHPDYNCGRSNIDLSGPRCQHIPGRPIDQAIAQLVLDTMNPVSVELALAVQHEIQSRQQETLQLRAKQVERAQYEADVFAKIKPAQGERGAKR
jgi:DNA invertase Pin-like site-specific DNA recombinase